MHRSRSATACPLSLVCRCVGSIDARTWSLQPLQRSATALLEDGYDIRKVQELLGHRDVRTTMTYLHVMHRGAPGVKSPMDRL